MDIGCAAELKATLLEALASRKPLQLELERSSDFDITALQLLWAAAREAERNGITLYFGAGPNEALARAAWEMGLDITLPATPCTASTGAGSAISQRVL